MIPEIYGFSFSKGKLTQNQSIGYSPTGALAMSADGKELYVANLTTGTVDVLNPSNLTRITQIAVQAGPINMIVNKAGTLGYVANFTSATVSVLDLVNNLNLTSISVGMKPYGLALTTPAAMVTAAPTQLTFTGSFGQSDPGSQNMLLSIDQTGGYSWTATPTTQSGGSWLSVSASSGTFPATLTVSVKTGTLAAGTYNGSLSIATTNTNTPQTVAVSFTVKPIGTLALGQTQVSFSTTAGSTAPAPVTLNITNSGIAGVIPWNAVITGPAASWLTLTPSSGTTAGPLTVSVNPKGLAAGTFSTTVTINSPATSNVLTLAVTLTLTAGPAVPSGGIVNAASFAAGAPVAIGSLVSVFGSNFGPATALGSSTIPLPTVLANVQVIIGGIPAPLVFVSSSQVNCQIPFELAGQTTTQVVVMNGNASSPAVTLTLSPSAPGIFTATLGGQTVGAILRGDSSQITPANPAKIGETIQIFATGQGMVTNQPSTGGPAPVTPPFALTPTNPTVLIGGQQAQVAFSGLTPGFVGLWQVNAIIPATVLPGSAVPVQTVQNGAISNSANIAVAAQ